MAGLNAVKSWIIEHAIKYNMKNVLKAAVSSSSDSSTQTLGNVPGLYLSIALLHTLEKASVDVDSQDFHIAVEVLDIVFKACKPDPLLKFFLILLTRMKMLALFSCLKNVDESMPYIRRYFPQWTDSYEEELKEDYGIKNPHHLHTLSVNYRKCRQFILTQMLMRHKENDKTKVAQIKNYSQQLLLIVKRDIHLFLGALPSFLPKTALELLMADASEESIFSDDPAIQFLLDCLQGDDSKNVTEAKLLQTLTALNATNSAQDLNLENMESQSQQSLSISIKRNPDASSESSRSSLLLSRCENKTHSENGDSLDSVHEDSFGFNVSSLVQHLKHPELKPCVVKLHKAFVYEWNEDVYEISC